MKLIRQTVIDDAALVSSSIAENDYAAWSSTTAYTTGSRTVRGHRVFESVQAANVGHDPALGDAAWWIDVGPTNRWAMFDRIVGTVSSASNSMTITLAPGRIDSLALLQVDAAVVSVVMHVGAAVVYSKTVSMLDNSEVVDWYSYFFAPIKQKDYLVLTDLPIFGEGTITVTISKPVGVVSVGAFIVGLQLEIGGTLRNSTLGINDYSRKDVDGFGNVTLVERSYSKKVGIKLIVKNNEIDRIASALAAVRATPAVWVASPYYSSMLVYGFYRDFEIDVAYAYESYCTLNIEGMI